MLSVPYTAIITVEKAKSEPQLAKIFRAHPSVFDPDEHADWEHHMLLAFLLYEW